MYHSVDNDTEIPQREPELQRAGRFWNKYHVHGCIVHDNHRPNWRAFDHLPRASSAREMSTRLTEPKKTEYISRNLILVNFLLLLYEDHVEVDSLAQAKYTTEPQKRRL